MSVGTVAIVSGANGEAVFSDETVDFRSDQMMATGAALRSQHETVKRAMFIELPIGWSNDSVFTDRRQIGVCLSGQIRFKLADGTIRDFEAGSVWRLVDVNVTGLEIEVIGSEAAACLVTHID